MLEEGNIIYFDPFYFANGNTAKPKYFIVLRNNNGQNVLASLPTRKDSIPAKKVKDSGCIELPEINLNCFVISPNEEVTECGKVFDFRTHIYGYNLDLYEVQMLEEIYPVENSDYVIWGKMKDSLFTALIECLKNSKIVKRKFKRILSR